MKPAIVTLALSTAAVLGYVTYRLTLAPPAPEPVDTVPIDASAAARSLRDTLPELTLPDLEGVERELASYAGRPLIVNFWATWCAPCLREIPRLKEYQQAHADKQIVGIAVDYREPVVEFAAEMAFNYPVLVGQTEGMNAATAFGVNVLALPITVFTSADGAVLAIHTGEVHGEHLDGFTAVVAALESGEIDLAAARERLAAEM